MIGVNRSCDGASSRLALVRQLAQRRRNKTRSRRAGVRICAAGTVLDESVCQAVEQWMGLLCFAVGYGASGWGRRSHTRVPGAGRELVAARCRSVEVVW
jgi:hypothetical protein